MIKSTRWRRTGKLALLLMVLSLNTCSGATATQPTEQPTSFSVPLIVHNTASPTPAPPTPTPEPQLMVPSFARQDTPTTNDLTQDGQSWSQASPILIDAYGKLIVPSQRLNNGNKSNIFVFSNDSGRTWHDNNAMSEAFIERGTAAYDAKNDVIHMLWIGTSADDGVFYRRYAPRRDASKNITAIDRANDKSLILDRRQTGDMFYQHPVLLHMTDDSFGANGALLAIWSVRQGSGKLGNEIRASLCILKDKADACEQAASWSAPAGVSTSSLESAPLVGYTALVANRTASIAYASALRKRAGTNAGDVYLFYHDGAGDGTGSWIFQRMRWDNTTQRWNGLTAAATIALQQRAGHDTGYNLKQQLGSRPVEDPAHDRIYFGFANWKDDHDGDTWSFTVVDAAHDDALNPIVDVYSAGGAHSYAPTGDITFDDTSARLVVSYIETKTQHVYVRLYDGEAATSAALLAFDRAPVDIPLLAWPARAGATNKLLMIFRDTINTPNPPYHGWAGTVTWN
ncbi:MAG: hypothetical protein ABIV47_19750 [Roseiflexaceae bacterium]